MTVPSLHAGAPAHRDVVLLHRARRQRVDAGGRRQAAVLGGDSGLRVLGDHEAGIDAGRGRQERRQAVRASRVEQAVGPSLRDRADLGDRDREEVAGEREPRPKEVSAGLDAPVGQHHRVVDRRRRAPRARPGARDRACRARRRRPVARSAASRRPGRAGRRGGGWRRSPSPRRSSRRLAALAACPGWGRSATRSAANARSVPSSASTDIAAVMSATRRRSVRSWIASTSIPSMPSVPLISARPSLALSCSGSTPAIRQGARRRRERLAAGADHDPLADQRQRAVGERSEVAARPDRPMRGHRREQVGVQQRQDRLDDQRPRPGAPHRERSRAQQHHRANDLALDRWPHAGGVRAHERALELLAAPSGDAHVGERPEARGDAVDGFLGGGEALDHGRRLVHRAATLGRQLDARAVAGDGHDLVRGEPAAAQAHRPFTAAASHTGPAARRSSTGIVIASSSKPHGATSASAPPGRPPAASAGTP